MLRFLFRGLTAEPARGAKLFDSITAEARLPTWYIGGQVPDSLDGRFAVLATITALVIVRIEQEGPAATALSVALTERFIEVMESEHRQLGLGDPTLGRTVRKLVSLLANRTALWRKACDGDEEWREATQKSLYKAWVEPEAFDWSVRALESLWARLDRTDIETFASGRLE